MALYKAIGVRHKNDGIFGLSPHKDVKKKSLHYLWALKDQNVIDRAMVSFSITSLKMEDKPYALFGGYNSSQIVGGAKGLKTFKNFDNWLGTWALEGQGMYYGEKPLQVPGEDVSYPAIIDTGSTRLSIPPDQFAKVKNVWKKAVPNMKCTEGGVYCHVDDQCSSFKSKLKPLGFQMSDYVFEINPDQYLLDEKHGHKNICLFIIK